MRIAILGGGLMGRLLSLALAGSFGFGALPKSPSAEAARYANTAYAATLTDDAFVTRFGSLRGVEEYVATGQPVGPVTRIKPRW